MPRTRNRLIAAARRSMLQRAELHRRLDVARAALKPKALLDRGKYRVGEKVDDAAHAVQEQFRSNKLPIALAAAAGIAWLLRDPIKRHAPKLTRKIQDLAADVADHFRAPDAVADEDEIEPLEEENDEAVR
ncbi:hypothetical protein [Sphingopyxis sp. H115]|uniref:hypothetical protein n=1 Tax=Sphingopyxis sp. H115 TaxID=1759073 RepID=UPI00073636FA|nr:hypothetical protein [Sphingopyxis sp. H115]KTE09464.1 hypothetical protein ATE71_12895 [Sphingopyxis sp. H115]